VSTLEQMSGKGMAEGVTRHSLADPRRLRRLVAGKIHCHRQSRAAERIFRATSSIVSWNLSVQHVA
jgi:hypothetical protein